MIWNPDCTEDPCDCPGEEVTDMKTTAYEGWGLGAAVARAWAEGYTAGREDEAAQRDARAAGSVAELTPKPNPYQRPAADCSAHELVQHRDRQRPWCNACGRAADGELIGRVGA